MASPHVAGLICYIRAAEGLADAKDVVDRMLELGQKGVLNGTTLNENPNLLAFNGIELDTGYPGPELVGGITIIIRVVLT